MSIDEIYLNYRGPLPVNLNPAFLFPRQRFDQINQMMQFAACFIQFAIDFKRKIDCQSLDQDMAKIPCSCSSVLQDKQCHRPHLKPLCMETYQNFFTAYRVPGRQKDTLLINLKPSNYIVVVCRNQVRFWLIN